MSQQTELSVGLLDLGIGYVLGQTENVVKSRGCACSDPNHSRFLVRGVFLLLIALAMVVLDPIALRVAPAGRRSWHLSQPCYLMICSFDGVGQTDCSPTATLAFGLNYTLVL